MMDTLRDLILRLLRGLAGAIPAGPRKNRIRSRLLRLRNGLPRELMVDSGDTVLQIGMWLPANLSRLARCVGPDGHVVLAEWAGSAYLQERGFQTTISRRGPILDEAWGRIDDHVFAWRE